MTLSPALTPPTTTVQISPSLSSPLPLTTLLLLAAVLRPSFSAAATTFPNCDRTFSCGSSVRDLSYPFTGGDRPAHCGPPQFRLTCRDNAYAELTAADSVTYRVLQLNSTQQTLVLARSDLWKNTCPQKFLNSTLDPTVFSSGDENQDLSLVYGCSSLANYAPYNVFNCVVSGASYSNAFYIVGPIPIYPIPNNIANCFVTIKVLVIGDAVRRLIGSQTTLGDALREGFSVNYMNPYSNHCSNCTLSGGQCGFDTNSSEPICICGGDRACSIRMVTGMVTGSNGVNVKLKLIIGFSAGGITILLLTMIICCLKRPQISLVHMVMALMKKESVDEQNVQAFLRNCGSLATKRYSYSDLHKLTNYFKDKVGQGGYGDVYKGKLSNGHLVAVKILNGTKGNGEEFINEVASITRTSHVNVVALLGYCFEGNRRALVYEFMAKGSLNKFIHNESHLELRTLYQIAVGTARGLEYLHRGCSTRIVHFDIKPQNILLDEDFCPKISDFGLAKLCQRKESIISMMGTRGTAGYIAPEVFSRAFGGVSHKSDVYSYGMLVLEMTGARDKVGVAQTSETYFPEWIYEHLEHVTELRLRGINTREDEETARKMILVGLWCIQTNPLDRPPMSRVVEMLEGSLQTLQIPPKSSMFSSERPDMCQDSLESLSAVNNMGDTLEGRLQPIQILSKSL